jgi:hypothetical protein
MTCLSLSRTAVKNPHPQPKKAPADLTFQRLACGVAVSALAAETVLNGQAAVASGIFDGGTVVTIAAPALAAAVAALVHHTWARGYKAVGTGIAITAILMAINVMGNSLHRTGGNTDHEMAVAGKNSMDAGRLSEQYQTAISDRDAASAKVQYQADHGGCRKLCKDQQALQAQAEAKIADLAEKLKHIDVNYTPPAEITRISALIGLFSSANQMTIQNGVVMVWPIILPICLTLATVFGFAVAFPPRHHKTVEPPTVAAALPVAANDADDEIAKVSRYLIELLQAGGKVESISKFAELAKVGVSSASRAADKLEASGQVMRQRAGRRVELRLVRD